jgi:heme-degrading monooxygenase HmoA
MEEGPSEMYIAMNRFRIALGHEEDFEKIWRERDSHLEEVPGFRSFDLLRGPVDDKCTLYASHTIWASEADFRAWTESEAFKKAHAQARAPSGTYLGHPVFEGFEKIL